MGMKLEEIMSMLEELGSEQTKKIYMNHGVKKKHSTWPKRLARFTSMSGTQRVKFH